MPDLSNQGLIITKPMLAAAKRGLGECMRCRAMLDDARTLGYPLPSVEAQLAELQPRLEGVVAYDAAVRGLNDDGRN